MVKLSVVCVGLCVVKCDVIGVGVGNEAYRFVCVIKECIMSAYGKLALGLEYVVAMRIGFLGCVKFYRRK